jgi:hypothetical protein
VLENAYDADRFGQTRRYRRSCSKARRGTIVSVRIGRKSPSDHADSYFGLMEDLEALLGRPIDLIEPDPISNPYLREEIERTKRSIYEAA